MFFFRYYQAEYVRHQGRDESVTTQSATQTQLSVERGGPPIHLYSEHRVISKFITPPLTRRVSWLIIIRCTDTRLRSTPHE